MVLFQIHTKGQAQDSHLLGATSLPASWFILFLSDYSVPHRCHWCCTHRPHEPQSWSDFQPRTDRRGQLMRSARYHARNSQKYTRNSSCIRKKGIYIEGGPSAFATLLVLRWAVYFEPQVNTSFGFAPCSSERILGCKTTWICKFSPAFGAAWFPHSAPLCQALGDDGLQMAWWLCKRQGIIFQSWHLHAWPADARWVKKCCTAEAAASYWRF